MGQRTEMFQWQKCLSEKKADPAETCRLRAAADGTNAIPELILKAAQARLVCTGRWRLQESAPISTSEYFEEKNITNNCELLVRFTQNCRLPSAETLLSFWPELQQRAGLLLWLWFSSVRRRRPPAWAWSGLRERGKPRPMTLSRLLNHQVWNLGRQIVRPWPMTRRQAATKEANS